MLLMVQREAETSQSPVETAYHQSKQDLDMVELKVGNMAFRFLEKQT